MLRHLSFILAGENKMPRPAYMRDRGWIFVSIANYLFTYFLLHPEGLRRPVFAGA